MAHQYDRWYQAFTIKDQDGHVLVPTDDDRLVVDSDNYDSNLRGIQGLEILINDNRYSDDDGSITFDDNTNQWKVYINQEQTDLERILSFQCAVDFGNQTVFNKDDLIKFLRTLPMFRQTFISGYKHYPVETYDFKNDPSGEYIWYDAAKTYMQCYPLNIANAPLNNVTDVLNVTHTICLHFKALIENNGLSPMTSYLRVENVLKCF